MSPRLTAFLALAAFGCSACSTLKPVAPWEKGYLAKPEMLLEGDRLAEAYREHIYFSKEAASGGATVGGGGCGCN